MNRFGYDECVNSEWMSAHPEWAFANHAYFYQKVSCFKSFQFHLTMPFQIPFPCEDPDPANCEMSEV